MRSRSACTFAILALVVAACSSSSDDGADEDSGAGGTTTTHADSGGGGTGVAKDAGHDAATSSTGIDSGGTGPVTGLDSGTGPVTGFDSGTGPVTGFDSGTIGERDSGTTVVDSGTAPRDSGTIVVDSGTKPPPVDSGTTAVDSGTTVVDSGTTVADSGSTAACLTGGTQSGGQQFCSNTQGNVAGGSGLSYQLWSSGQGTGCMNVFSDGSFKANWTSVGDFLARVGLGFNSTKTPSAIGTISADFNETHTGSGGTSYIAVYGWSENPLHEYYIMDDWIGNRPLPGTKVGTITVDGAVYDVLTHTQTNQPAITGGNQTFVQFWSVRQTARSCGHISISQHFSGWSGLGLQMGNLEEARILVEALGGSGNIDFSVAKVQVN